MPKYEIIFVLKCLFDGLIEHGDLIYISLLNCRLMTSVVSLKVPSKRQPNYKDMEALTVGILSCFCTQKIIFHMVSPPNSLYLSIFTMLSYKSYMPIFMFCFCISIEYLLSIVYNLVFGLLAGYLFSIKLN